MLALCRLSYQYFCALAVFAVATQFSSALLAQETSAQLAAAVPQGLIAQPLITQRVDETQLTVLKGNTHPLARPAFDLGTAAATLPMQRMLLVLKRSPQQEAALRKLLDDQQRKSSPNQRQRHADHYFVVAVTWISGGIDEGAHGAGVFRFSEPGEGSISHDHS
jgi:hypothetical protein